MRMRLRRTALINYGNTLPGYAAGEVIVHIKKYTRARVPRGVCPAGAHCYGV